MRRRILLIVLLLVLLGAGLIFFLPLGEKQGQTELGFASFLPRDTPLVLGLYDLSGLADRLPRTPLGRFLSPAVLEPVLAELGVAPEQVRAYGRLHAGVMAALGHPAFRMVFGDDAILALLPLDRRSFARQPLAELRRNLLVLATTHSGRVLERVGRTVMPGSLSTVRRDRLEMVRLQLDGSDPLYGWIGEGRVLLALEPGAIVRAVNTGKQAAGESLAACSVLGQASAFWRQHDPGRTYIRGFLRPGFLPGVSSTGGSDPFSVPETVFWTGGQDNTSWLLHAAAKPAVFPDGFLRKNRTLFLLEGRPLLYGWSARAVPLLIDGMAKLRPGRPESVFPDRAFSPQGALSLVRMGQNRLLPLPHWAAAVPVHDPDAARRALDRFREMMRARGHPREVRKKTASGTTLFTWPVFPVDGASPALVLDGGWLLAASSPARLRHLLARVVRPGTEQESTGYRLGPYLDGLAGQADLGLLVFRPARFARQAGPVLDRLGRVVRLRSGASFRRLSHELLLLMQGAELVFSAFWQEDGLLRGLLLCRSAQNPVAEQKTGPQ